MSLTCKHGKSAETPKDGDEIFRSEEAHTYESTHISTPCKNKVLHEVCKKDDGFGPIERALEEIRSKNYSNKPTRLDSFFAFNCKQCAEDYREYTNNNNDSIYTFKIKKCQHSLIADFGLRDSLLSTLDGRLPKDDVLIKYLTPDDLIEKVAQAYWGGRPSGDFFKERVSKPELLLMGEFELINEDPSKFSEGV